MSLILFLALQLSIALTTPTAFTNIGCNPVCKPGDEESYITFKDCIQKDINKRNIYELPNFYELYNDACQAKYDVEFQDFMIKNANSWFTLFQNKITAIYTFFVSNMIWMSSLFLCLFFVVVFGCLITFHLKNFIHKSQQIEN